MTVLDASAVLAYLKREVDHLVRIAGAGEEDAVLDLAQLGLAETSPTHAVEGAEACAPKGSPTTGDPRVARHRLAVLRK